MKISAVHFVFWTMSALFIGAALLELTSVLGPHNQGAGHTGAVIGLGWFAAIGLICAIVPLGHAYLQR